MPYIQQHKRDVLDPIINQLLNALRELECDDATNNFEGNVNYIITRVLSQVYTGGSYRELNDAMGILSCVSHEYYRRIAVRLENQKCYANGDVFDSPQ